MVTTHKGQYFFPQKQSTLIWNSLILPCFGVQHEFSNQTATKQESPKYPAEQSPINQTDSLRKEKNQKLFSKPDSFVYKLLPCHRINLSLSQTLFLDGVETAVLLPDFAH